VTESPDNKQPESRQPKPCDFAAIDALRTNYKRNVLREANYGWLVDAA